MILLSAFVHCFTYQFIQYIAYIVAVGHGECVFIQ